ALLGLQKKLAFSNKYLQCPAHTSGSPGVRPAGVLSNSSSKIPKRNYYTNPKGSSWFRNRGFSAAAPAVDHVDSSSVTDPSRIRNVAVIAHVDHGKTTLMDRLMRQCGADVPHERAMDSISLERERGITISSKVTSLPWNGTELNMVDTPGHADFGGEVERVVGMVEGAVLVVDAGEVSEERCGEVESLIFDLFANLGASEEQLEFPVLYASAKEGWASQTFTKQPAADQRNMSALLDAILKHVPPPQGSLEAPFQMLVSMMERDVYLGRILTGRISSGIVRVGDKVHGLRKTDSGSEKIEEGKVVKLMKKKGTSTAMVDCAGSGDIISIAGLANPSLGHTISSVEGGKNKPRRSQSNSCNLEAQINTGKGNQKRISEMLPESPEQKSDKEKCPPVG
ncbi:hypothetical protein KI387_043326, partial [Taxus chinensis]